MKNGKYSMSFTTGSGLFSRESVELTALYLDMGDWNAVRDKVIRENLLQSRTLNTLKRICSEVISRLKTLSSEELELLVKTDPREQCYLLWLSVCRRYPFIAEFAVEVLRERYISLKSDLNPEDFDSFFNGKSQLRSELDRIRPATKAKLRQVLFKMLHEADLLTGDNRINAAMLSPRLLRTITNGAGGDVLFFPAFESDLRMIAR